MSPIHISFDTSAQNNPGAGIERLQQLAEYGIVKVYVSEIVRKEWINHLEGSYRESLKNSLSGLQKVTRNMLAKGVLNSDSLNATSTMLQEALGNASRVAESYADQLIENLKAETLPIGKDHGAIIVENYFRGIPPFT